MTQDLNMDERGSIFENQTSQNRNRTSIEGLAGTRDETRKKQYLQLLIRLGYEFGKEHFQVFKYCLDKYEAEN